MRWRARLFGVAWAWILWQRAEFSALEPGANTPSAGPTSTPYGSYGTVAECEAAKVKLFETTTKQYQPSADTNEGVESVNSVTNEMVVITFRGRGGSVALQFRCLPDTVDLRAPKTQ